MTGITELVWKVFVTISIQHLKIFNEPSKKMGLIPLGHGRIPIYNGYEMIRGS